MVLVCGRNENYRLANALDLDRTSAEPVGLAAPWTGPLRGRQIQRWNQMRASHSAFVSSSSVQIGQNQAKAIRASTV
jgi:hypothetical protein